MNKLKIDNNIKKILIVLVIYLVIMLIIFLPGYLKNRKENLYIVTNRFKIKLEKGKWKNIKDSKDYNLKDFNIYEDGEYLGDYKVILTNKFTLFDSSDNVVKYNGYLLGYRGSLKTDISNYTFNSEENESDEQIVKQALKKVNIDSDAFYNITQKQVLDVDNDGKDEIIYNIINIGNPSDDSLDGISQTIKNSSNKNFSIVFIYKDGNVKIIDKIITKEEVHEEFSLVNVVDIRDDKKLELIYVKGYPLDPLSECPRLTDLKSGKQIHDFCKD